MDMFNIKSKDFRDFKNHMDLKKPGFGGPSSAEPFDKSKRKSLKGYTRIAKRDADFEMGGSNPNYDGTWFAVHNDRISRDAKIKPVQPRKAIPAYGSVAVKESHVPLFEEFMFEDEDDIIEDSPEDLELDEQLIEDFIEEFGDDIKEILEIACEKMEMEKEECIEIMKEAISRITEMPEEEDQDEEDRVDGGVDDLKSDDFSDED